MPGFAQLGSLSRLILRQQFLKFCTSNSTLFCLKKKRKKSKYLLSLIFSHFFPKVWWLFSTPLLLSFPKSNWCFCQAWGACTRLFSGSALTHQWCQLTHSQGKIIKIEFKGTKPLQTCFIILWDQWASFDWVQQVSGRAHRASWMDAQCLLQPLTRTAECDRKSLWGFFGAGYSAAAVAFYFFACPLVAGDCPCPENSFNGRIKAV